MAAAGAGEITRHFGWYLSLKSLAESGVFNQTNHTPLKSAQLADLYEAFNYLSAVKAEIKLQENVLKNESTQRK